MLHETPHIQALKLWKNTAFELIHEGHDLSLRQIAILITVYLDPPPHTVRGLARQLQVTKPVITRALDSLGKQDLLSRRRDEHDRRNVIILKTVKGALTVEKIADTILHNLPPAQQPHPYDEEDILNQANLQESFIF
jgi:Transcriptional regulators